MFDVLAFNATFAARNRGFSVTNKDKNNKKILNEIKQQVEFEDFNEE